MLLPPPRLPFSSYLLFVVVVVVVVGAGGHREVTVTRRGSKDQPGFPSNSLGPPHTDRHILQGGF